MTTQQLNNSFTRRTLLTWASIVLLILVACPAKTVEPAHIRYNTDAPSEYELKAIYLYNFLQFVKWPVNSCDLHEGRSHQIAVLGDSPFTKTLQALQNKLQEKDKELKLTFYGPYQPGINLHHCCLLFITRSEQKNLPQILEILAGKPVLTVADSDGFVEQGVMISLLSRKNKIRWAINRRPVEESGLRISAKMLDIAVKIID